MSKIVFPKIDLDALLDSVSPDTGVSPDTDRKRRYKKKLSRINLDYHTEESDQIRQEAAEMGVSVAEYVRKALQVYRETRRSK